jgi:adenylate kinase
MEAVILFGPPGSGKGTQAALLVKRYGWAHLATGDLFREAIARRDPVALEAQDLMKAGRLVPDELVGQIVRGKLEQLVADSVVSGVVFDGYPRNVAQVGHLDAALEASDVPLRRVLALEVDEDVLVKRLTGRRTCPTCGRLYNIYFAPSMSPDRCDDDGAELTSRADDNEETIRERLRVYREQTEPVLDAYRRRDQLDVVNGTGDMGEVFERISAIVDQWAKHSGAEQDQGV